MIQLSKYKEFEAITPLICEKNKTLPIKLIPETFSNPALLHIIDSEQNIAYSTVPTYATKNNTIFIPELTLNENIKGLFQYALFLANGDIYYSNWIEYIDFEFVDNITQKVTDSHSLISFFPESQWQIKQNRNICNPIAVDYDKLISFKINYLEDHTPESITNMYLVKVESSNLAIYPNGNGFITSQIIQVSQPVFRKVGNTFIFDQQILLDYFFDAGLYIIKLIDSDGNIYLSSLLQIIFPSCSVFNKTLPDPAITASGLGEFMTAFYDVANINTIVQFQVLISGVWTDIGTPQKTFYLEGNSVILPYDESWQYIRYVNYIDTCVIGTTREYEINAVSETFFRITQSGAIRITQGNNNRIIQSHG